MAIFLILSTKLDEKGPKQEETIRFSTENDNESIANNETGLRELLGIQTTFCVKSTNVELDSKMNSKFVYNPQSDKQLSIKVCLFLDTQCDKFFIGEFKQSSKGNNCT